MATKKRTTTKKAASAKRTTKAAKKATPDKPKKVSQIDAAIKVLGTARKPMSCKELVEAMTKKKLWTSPGGATPDATLYASILRDLKKGKDARFKKAAPGKFTLAKKS